MNRESTNIYCPRRHWSAIYGLEATKTERIHKYVYYVKSSHRTSKSLFAFRSLAALMIESHACESSCNAEISEEKKHMIETKATLTITVLTTIKYQAIWIHLIKWVFYWFLFVSCFIRLYQNGMLNKSKIKRPNQLVIVIKVLGRVSVKRSWKLSSKQRQRWRR